MLKPQQHAEFRRPTRARLVTRTPYHRRDRNALDTNAARSQNGMNPANNFMASFLHHSFAGRVSLALLLALAVATIDVVTGDEIRVYPFYFVPLVIASTSMDRRGAILFATLCAALWLISKVLDGTQFQSSWIWAWNIAMQEAAFVFVAILVSGLRAAMAREATLSQVLTEQNRQLIEGKVELERLNSGLSNAIRSREDSERISRHDLKTPLASIAATPALLRKGRILSSEDERLLRMIESAANRALGMINLSLNLQKMEAGQYIFKPSRVDLTQIVLAVIDDLSMHAASKSVSIQLTGDEPHLFVEAESMLCYSIVSNIMKNAVEAAPDQSMVRVSLLDGPQIRLSIRNAGAIPSALRDRFFTKYATHGKESGSGLGAYSARLMAQAQQGSLTMESSDVLGTTLTLALNRSAEPELVSGTKAMPRTDSIVPEVPRSISSQRVLIVDDEPYNQLVLTKILPIPPVVVEMAINGRMALESVMAQRPDIIFMDIEMPVMGGIEAQERIREFQAKAGQLPSMIVAFSANDDAKSLAKYRASGFDTCLSKPCSPRDVLALLMTEPILETSVHIDGAVVRVDKDLFLEVPSFLETRRALIADMREAMSIIDHESVRQLAHKLAGSLAVFGFEWASSTCKEIEKLAGTDQLALMKIKTEMLSQHLDGVQVRPSN